MMPAGGAPHARRLSDRRSPPGAAATGAAPRSPLGAASPVVAGSASPATRGELNIMPPSDERTDHPCHTAALERAR
jgi:hypothetical protein